MRVAVLGINSKADLAASQEAVKRLSSSTLRVIAELARLGGLRVSRDISLPTPTVPLTSKVRGARAVVGGRIYMGSR